MLKKLLYAIPVIIIVLVGGTYFLVNREAKNQADLLISQALAGGSYEELSYESVKVDLFNGELTIKNLRIVDLQHTEYILHQLVISDYDYLHEIPHHITIAANGISFPRGLPEIEATDNAAFEEFVDSIIVGDSIPIMISYHYDFEPENNNLIESEMGVGLENVASFSFNSSFKNIPLEALANNEQLSPELAQVQLMTILLGAEIPEARLAITDLGIIDSIIAIQAEQNSMSEDVFRQQLVATVKNLYMFAPPDTQQIAMEINQELATFIEGNKTFSISIEPEFNGSIQSLQPQIMGAVFSGNYSMILELLNLEVSTQ